MPDISELRGKYPGGEIHIIGTGPTITFLPVQEMLKDKITIGLNEAFTYGNWTYHISIHPEIVAKKPNLNWITKIKGSLQLPWQRYYLFCNQQDANVHNFDLVIHPQSGKLYVGRGIHTAAVVLAAEMGAKYIYLYGIDCNGIRTLQHSHPQSTQFYGLQPAQVYREYYENLVVLRDYLHRKYETHLITMTPCLGFDYQREDFDHLMKLHGLTYPENPPPEIKKYTRKVDKFL